MLPGWSPMRDLLFRQMACCPDIRLRVFFEKASIPDRPGWQVPGDTGYETVILNSITPIKGLPDKGLPLTLPGALRQFRPHAVVVTNLTEAVFVMAAALDTRLILWTGETRHILSQRAWPGLSRAIRPVILPRIHAMACYTRRTLAYLEKTCGVDRQTLFTVPQCVDNSFFSNKAEGKKTADFLAVGRLVPAKGLRRLIRALEALPGGQQPSLTIAGSGPLEKELRAMAKAAAGVRIVFAGQVPYERLPEVYRESRALVFPTLNDNWGFVVNEAMASGLPVLCSVFAGASQLVGEGQNGLLCNPMDEVRFVQSVSAMLDLRDRWPIMGANGQRRVCRDYTAKASAKAMLDGILKELSSK